MLTTTWLPRGRRLLLMGVALITITAGLVAVPAQPAEAWGGTLIIEKTVVGQDAVTAFGITTSVGVPVFGSGVSGVYTAHLPINLDNPDHLSIKLHEIPVANYATSGWACTASNGAPVVGPDPDRPDASGSAVVELEREWWGSRFWVKCSITNTFVPPLGSITVEKVTTEGNDTFDFLWGREPFSITTTDGSDTEVFDDLEAGTYNISEVVPDGWAIVSVVCDAVEWDGYREPNPGAQVYLQPGEDVTCTFTNEGLDLPTITVKKLTPGVETEQQFGFDLDYLGDGDFAEFSLGSGAERMMTVRPGSYSLNELVPDGWALTGAACRGGEPVRLDGGDDHAVVAVGYGDDVVCTFTNELAPDDHGGEGRQCRRQLRLHALDRGPIEHAGRGDRWLPYMDGGPGFLQPGRGAPAPCLLELHRGRM